MVKSRRTTKRRSAKASATRGPTRKPGHQKQHDAQKPAPSLSSGSTNIRATDHKTNDDFQVVLIQKGTHSSPPGPSVKFTFLPSSSTLPSTLNDTLGRESYRKTPSMRALPGRDRNPQEQPFEAVTFNHLFCGADTVSETKIKDDVLNLNHLVQNLILNTMTSVKPRSPRNRDQIANSILPLPELKEQYTSPLEEIYADKLFYGRAIRDPNMRDLVTEAFIRDKICRLLYNYFFTGKHFFGLGISKDAEKFLGKIFDILQTEERLLVAQSWRSLTASAILKGDTSKKLSAATFIPRLSEAFFYAHPFKSNRFHNQVWKTLNENQPTIDQILDLCRQLTINLQSRIVSCDMRVMIAPRQSRIYDPFDHKICRSAWSNIDSFDGDQVLGTFEFGLQYVDEARKKRIIIHPLVITDPVLKKLTGNA